MTELPITSPPIPETIRSSSSIHSFRRYTDPLKRLFDISIAFLGLVLSSPVLIFLAWLIKRDSPGPALFRSPRIGRRGRVFRMLKFRTMYERPESYQGTPVTAQDDPRITPVGRWLRDTKLNELPQLWNVLKGEMSLVGPRPEDPQIVETWPEAVRSELLSVRPGMTSPASVLYRDEEGMLHNSHVMEAYLGEILPSKLRLDQLYVRHRSFWGDLDLLFWTFLVLIPQAKTYSPPEEILFVGPIWKLMRRHVSWFAADAVVTFLAMGLTGLIWRSFGPLQIGWDRAIGLALGFALLFSFAGAILGANRIDWSKASATDVFDLLPGAILASAIALLVNHLVHFSYPQGEGIKVGIYWSAEPLLPIGMVLTAAGLSVFGFVVLRYRSRLITGLATRWVIWRRPSAANEQVLIVGGGETGQFAAWMLSQGNQPVSFRVAGFVDDDLYKQGIRIRGINVLGQRSDIPDLVEKYDIGIIIFAIHNISAKHRNQLLKICSLTPARVTLFPDIPAALGQLISLEREKSESSKKIPLDPNWTLPCHLCLMRTSPMRVDGWLVELEQLVKSGDLTSVESRLKELRSHLNPDVEEQLKANLGNTSLENSETLSDV